MECVFCPLRVTLYWGLCVGTFAILISGGSLFGGTTELWNEFARIGPLAFLPLPLVLLDCLIFSNRMAGPIFRLRQALDDLNAGRPAETIHLRKGDFHADVADALNRLIENQPTSEASRPVSKSETQPGQHDDDETVLMDAEAAPSKSGPEKSFSGEQVHA